jgi:putative tryptophan/tyrosine transport system substrate-binding protein
VIRRREFITLLGGGVAAWPLAAGAQQPAKRVIGYLGSADSDHMVGALREGLAERGYIEGQSISIEVHDVAGQYDRLPSLAAEFVKRQVAIIVAVGNANAALAAKKATAVIPIVFANGGDPIKLGLVGSINRPGGNVTGVTFFNSLLISKRLELLSEVIPRSARIGFLMNPTTPNADSDVKDMETAAMCLNREPVSKFILKNYEIGWMRMELLHLKRGWRPWTLMGDNASVGPPRTFPRLPPPLRSLYTGWHPWLDTNG